MAAPSWAIGYLAVTAFLFMASNLICSGELAETDGTVFDTLLNIVGFGACDGMPDWASFAITLLVVLPAIFLVWSLLSPVLAGAAANAIVGTIISTAIIVAIVAILVQLV